MPTNTWTANVGTKNWNVGANWSLGTVPAAGEDVVFDGTGSANCNIDVSTAALLTITKTDSITVTQAASSTVTCTGLFSVNGGTWDVNAQTLDVGSFSVGASVTLFDAGGAATITCSGSLTVADVASIADFATSTVTIDGTGNLSNPRATNSFNNLTLSGAITTTITGNFQVEGLFVTGGGTSTIQDDGSNRTIFLENGMTNNGPTWNATAGGRLEIEWAGGGATTIPADDYGNLKFEVRDAGTVATIGGNITCYTMTLADGSTVNLGSNTLTLTVTGAVGLQVGGSSPALDDCTFDVQTGTVDIAGNLTLSGANTNANTLDFGSGTVKVAGDVIYDDADAVNPVVTADTGTLQFDGSGAQSFDAGGSGITWPDVDILSTNTVTLATALTCAALTVNNGSTTFDTDSGNDYAVTCTGWSLLAGTVNANGSTIQVAGNCVMSGGTFNKGTSTVQLTASGNLLNSTSGNSFNQLTQNGSITTTLTGDVYADNATMGAGSTLQTNGADQDFRIQTTLTVNTVTWSSNGADLRIFFEASGAATLPGDDYGDASLHVIRNGSSTTFGGAVITTGLFRMQAASNNQTCTVSSGGFNLTCGELQAGADANSTRGGRINFTGTSTLTVNGNCTVYDDDGAQINRIAWDAANNATSTITGNLSVEADGELDWQSSTHTLEVGGNIVIAATAVIDESAGTIKLNGSGTQDITTNGQTLNNIEVNGTSTIELQDALTCTNFTMTAGTFDTNSVGNYALNVTNFDQNTGTFLANGSTITVTGNCEITGGTLTVGTSTFDCTGTGNITNTSTARAFNILKIAAATKTTTLTGNVLTKKLELGTGVWTAGGAYQIQFWLPPSGQILTNAGVTVDASGGTNPNLYFGATGAGIAATLQTINMGSGAVSFQPGSAASFTLLGALTTSGTVTLRNDGNNGSLDLDTFNLTSGALIIGSAANANVATMLCGSGTVDCTSFSTLAGATGALNLNLETCTFQCSGDFAINHANHVITKGTSTVKFDGTAAQTVTMAGEQFHHITITNSHASGVTFADAMNYQGTLTFDSTASAIRVDFDETGTHIWGGPVAQTGTNVVTLRSEADGNQWDVTASTDSTLAYMDVKDSNLSGATMTVDDGTSTDSGNNSANWDFISIIAATQHHAGGTFLSQLAIGV